MPHVLVGGEVCIRAWSERFSSIEEETDHWLIRAEEVYVERQGNRAIVPVVVVEEGHHQSFYLRLSQGNPDKGLTVRLDMATDPIKTRGVKRAVALVAENILSAFEGSWVERHNLHEFIKEEYLR